MLAFKSVFCAVRSGISDSGTEEEAYGGRAIFGAPLNTRRFRQDFMVGMYSHFDTVHPMRTVPKPASAVDF